MCTLLIITTTIVSAADLARGLYVNKFDEIYNNTEKKEELYQYIERNGITHLSLYKLYVVMVGDLDSLNTFIGEAKARGIQEVLGVGGRSHTTYDRIIAYNQNHQNKFDGFVTEYEYWNDDPETPDEFVDLLKYLQEIAGNDMTVQAYLGWTEPGDAERIGPLLDRLFLHAYRTSPDNAYDYTDGRLEEFSNHEKPLEVWPIYAAKGGDENFMKQWFIDNSIAEAEEMYLNDFDAETAAWKAGINLNGFQYFAYTYMKEVEDKAEDSIINLKEGYQFTSLTVTPRDLDVEEIFNPVLDNLDYIESIDQKKLYYDGIDWVNNIGDWNTNQAYLVKMKSPMTLRISASSIISQQKTITVNAGKNLVPVWVSDTDDIEGNFGPALSNLTTIRNDKGQVCRKVNNVWVHGIKQLTTGEGLLIDSDSSFEFTYPVSNQQQGEVTDGDSQGASRSSSDSEAADSGDDSMTYTGQSM